MEHIYIAGPECFYSGGYEQWNAMRRMAEASGAGVTLPNDAELNLSHDDLRKNADEIFRNCAHSMNRSTAIIADLEFFRGPEMDGGTAYEIGMAYARGLRCYGYTRDRRSMVWKYQYTRLKDGAAYDRKGRRLPYAELPFPPDIVGSTKIVEGRFEDCLRIMLADVEEEKKQEALGVSVCRDRLPQKAAANFSRPVVFLAGPERYENGAAEVYSKMKDLCTAHGLEPVTPLDFAPGITAVRNPDDPLISACRQFKNNCAHVVNCDAVVANLNDFHVWEPDGDTSFECGMAFQLGKKLFGYRDSVVRMRDRVPNLGPEREYRDERGCNVENFDYPCNLMFSSSMPILEGGFEAVIPQIARVLCR